MKFVIIILIVAGLILMWKKTEWKKVIKIIVSVILGLVLIGTLLSSPKDDKDDGSKDKPKAQQEQQQEEKIEYADVTVDELYDALEKNAVNASDTYKGGYYAVTGKLMTIDASGDYISLTEINDEYSFNSMNCYIKSDEQLERVKQLSKGDTVTVRGKIKDVGEILGYSLDIDSID